MPLTQVQNGMLAGVIPASLGGTGTTAGVTGFKNRLINGSMDIWQRGTSFSAPALLSYTVDRWATMWGNSNRTYSQQTGFSGSQFCLRVQRNSGTADTGYQGVAQFIETNNVYGLQGQQVTLSFSARCGANYSSASNALLVSVNTGTVADQGGSVYWSPGWTGIVYNSAPSITLTTTAQQFSFTTTIPANCLEIAVQFQYQASGTAGAADFFEITNVQLEAGPSATNFDYLPYSTELQLCQRYFEKSYDIGTVPGTSNTLSQSIGLGIYTNTPAAYNRFGNVYFKVTKRATPTIVQYAPATGNSAASGNATSGDGGTDVGYTTPNQVNTNGFNFAASVGGSTVTNYYTVFFAYTANAEL